MSDIDITVSSIDVLLSNLNAHKAAGPDGISALKSLKINAH